MPRVVVVARSTALDALRDGSCARHARLRKEVCSVHPTASDVGTRFYVHSLESGCVCVYGRGRSTDVAGVARASGRRAIGGGGSRIPDLGRAMLADELGDGLYGARRST